MRITYLGHAGLHIETKYGSIVCDPWFTPAYFGSWFPYPRNDRLDRSTFRSPDYLYVSHLHRDHFDAATLQEIDRSTTVLLPDFPMPHLREEFEALGFQKFFQTTNGELHTLNGLTIGILALAAPGDGPAGDSALFVDDGTTRLLNQNDARPIDFESLTAGGEVHAHFLQFSGAIWYPMVYDMEPEAKRELAIQKRKNQLSRATRYVTGVNAAHVFPSAGPPCFLDEDLFHLNDLDQSPDNIFPNARAFVHEIASTTTYPADRVHHIIPGSEISLEGADIECSHPGGEAAVARALDAFEAELREYQNDWRPWLVAERASWPDGKVDVFTVLKQRIERVLHNAAYTRAGVGGNLLLNLDAAGQIVIDFPKGEVREFDGDPIKFRFSIDHRLVESVLIRELDDWVNSIFLSCRFAAEREGPYNEYVYNFFKALSPQRMRYAEKHYAAAIPDDETIELGEWTVQRRCPHQKADLTDFGRIEGCTLHCAMHGWEWDLESGACLTADKRPIRASRTNTAP
jgi:UDP-MurNAc hydroxylase